MYFSTTTKIRRPIFWANRAISMNRSSLKPLQTIGTSSEAMPITASSSGLLPPPGPTP